jgi:hypothetical protein
MMEATVLASGLVVMAERPTPDPPPPFREDPCPYCDGLGMVDQLDNGVMLQAGLIAYGCEFRETACLACGGASYGEPYSTDRRSDKSPPPGVWVLRED